MCEVAFPLVCALVALLQPLLVSLLNILLDKPDVFFCTMGALEEGRRKRDAFCTDCSLLLDTGQGHPQSIVQKMQLSLVHAFIAPVLWALAPCWFLGS